MAQDYDKIFREVLKDIFPAVARKVLGIPSGEYKPLPVDLQYTSEREADQLWEVVPSGGKPFILHCGFQAGNDKQMLSRMLLVDLRSFSCQTFLESSGSREVILAILADFEGEPAGLIAEKIISKLEELCEGKPELSQRTLQLVRLAVLRNLPVHGVQIVKRGFEAAVHAFVSFAQPHPRVVVLLVGALRSFGIA